CIDNEQWLQEYCCIPADESAAFITYEMINSCEDEHLKLMTIPELIQYCLKHPDCTLYLGMDVARKKNLCVIDVGERVGDVIWDRLSIEFHNRTSARSKRTFIASLSCHRSDAQPSTPAASASNCMSAPKNVSAGKSRASPSLL